MASSAARPLMELPNPNRIDLDDRAQVLLWADLLAISAERLVEIAGKVGPMRAAIRFYATRLGDEKKPAPAKQPAARPGRRSSPTADGDGRPASGPAP